MTGYHSGGATQTIVPACVSSHPCHASQSIAAAAAVDDDDDDDDDDEEEEEEDEDVVKYCYWRSISVYCYWLQDVRHYPHEM